MTRRLEELAEQMSVDADVQFTAPLFGENKWAAYRDADVFVLPSQNENFGNAAAEAIVAGTAVIVTEQCGIAPLLANGAGVVVRHNAEQLAEALLRVLSDEELRGHLRAGCAKVAVNLGWEGPLRETESLYFRCVSQRQGRERTSE